MQEAWPSDVDRDAQIKYLLALGSQAAQQWVGSRAVNGSVSTAVDMSGGGFARDTVVRTWTNNINGVSIQFGLLADGRMFANSPKRGLRVWRPKKSIVVSNNPRVGNLARAAKRLDHLTAGLIKSKPLAKRASDRMVGVKRRRRR